MSAVPAAPAVAAGASKLGIKLPETFRFIPMQSGKVFVNEEELQRNRFQIVVGGDPEVGKSTYLKLLQTNEFDPVRRATTRMDIVTLFVKVAETKRRAKLVFYDLVGEDVRRVDAREPLVQHTDAVLLLFDATRPATFDSLARWRRKLDFDIGANDYYLIVACNKVDMLADEGEALVDKVNEWRRRATAELRADQFVLVSAKTGQNCYELCYELVASVFTVRDRLDHDDALTGVTSPRMIMRNVGVAPRIGRVKRCLAF